MATIATLAPGDRVRVSSVNCNTYCSYLTTELERPTTYPSSPARGLCGTVKRIEILTSSRLRVAVVFLDDGRWTALRETDLEILSGTPADIASAPSSTPDEIEKRKQAAFFFGKPFDGLHRLDDTGARGELPASPRIVGRTHDSIWDD